MFNRRFRVVGALVLALALITAGCGSDPDEDSTETTAAAGSDTTAAGDDTGSDTTAAAGEADYKACEVTDTGGVDDKSFNQTAYAGLEQAESELGVEIDVAESTAATDYEPNINAFIDGGCDLIVTVGFLLGDATAAAAEANPDQSFAIVDNDFFDADAGEDIVYDNVKELTFKTDEAAFLAGYLAAGMSESGTVGTYGGLNIPTVSIFMEGMRLGVEQYNEDNGAEVKLLGWDGTDGLFTGDFEDQDKGRQTTESLIDECADIIMPVAGPVGLGSVEAARAADGVSLIWVDVDGCVSVADACDLFLTTVEKKMDLAVFDAVKAGVDGAFEGGLYSGTLENGGVDIADYNEFEDDVPQELKDKVQEYKDMIIAGEYSLAG